MANDYKCDICHGSASVHITKIIDGKKVKIHLCADCAQKASLDALTASLDILPKIKHLEEEFMSSKKIRTDSCPNCGASLSEIEKGARMSCPDCYAALGDRLADILLPMHGAVAHSGKSPKSHKANYKVTLSLASPAGEQFFDDMQDEELTIEGILGTPDTEDETSAAETEESIKEKLKAAIKEERYEDAALLRDKLKHI